MTELSLPKDIVMIKLKSGKAIFTSGTVEQVASLLENKSFVAIDGFGFNRFEVETFEKYNPNDIEMYILAQTDNQLKDRLWKIYNERVDKWLRINGVKHLMEIYDSRFNDTK